MIIMFEMSHIFVQIIKHYIGLAKRRHIYMIINKQSLGVFMVKFAILYLR